MKRFNCAVTLAVAYILGCSGKTPPVACETNTDAGANACIGGSSVTWVTTSTSIVINVGGTLGSGGANVGGNDAQGGSLTSVDAGTGTDTGGASTGGTSGSGGTGLGGTETGGSEAGGSAAGGSGLGGTETGGSEAGGGAAGGSGLGGAESGGSEAGGSAAGGSGLGGTDTGGSESGGSASGGASTGGTGSGGVGGTETGGTGGAGTGGAMVIDCPDCLDVGGCIITGPGSSWFPRPDGTPCRNGNGCDGFERCHYGMCEPGTPPPDGSICGDGLVCTSQICHRASDLVGPHHVVDMGLGTDFTCSVLADGTVRCSGNNIALALGGGTDRSRLLPVASIVGLGVPKQIAVGCFDGAILLNDGTVQFWGRDVLGTMALPGTVSISHACGKGLCAVSADGAVQCWGSATTPTGLTDAIAISVNSNTCALRANGTVQCWGTNTYGELGNGTTVASSVPVDVVGITNATAIGTGGNHACALLRGGTVRCWGNNYNGALGDGTGANSTIPVEVVGITDAQSLTVGNSSYACVVLADRTARCWGWNANGALGDGTTSNRLVPTPVSGLTDVAELRAGTYHTCAILTDRTARCWGANPYGQLGDGTTNRSLTPVQVRYSFP